MRPNSRNRKPVRKKSLRPGGTSPPPPRGKVLAIAERVVESQGCELLEKHLGESEILRLVVDRAEGSLDSKLMVTLIKELRRELIANSIDPGRYRIEVDSPGERRLLKNAAHYERFAGERVRIALAEKAEDGATTMLAELLGADGDAPRVRLEDGSEETLAAGSYTQIRLAP